MAMVWITHIYNFRPETFVLRQNDPTYHPVIKGHQYNDEPIYVTPGYNEDASWFVIPWASTNTSLTAQGPKGTLTFNVGPAKASDTNDSLRAYDRQQNESVTFEVGPKGPNFVASCSLHLVFNDNGMVFQVWDANNIGGVILSHLAADLEKIATDLLEKLLTNAAFPAHPAVSMNPPAAQLLKSQAGLGTEEQGRRLYSGLG